MKKFFIIVAILIVVANLYDRLTYKDIRTPCYEFKTHLSTASLNTYRDTDFGYTISYPCIFRQEEQYGNKFLGYARFVYSDDADVILESYITKNLSPNLQACADSLAQRLHATKSMTTNGHNEPNTAFILKGPAYENDVRVDGYSHYDKYIKSGKMLFVYSLTYPDSYQSAMPRLFQLIDNWQIMGAY